MVAPKNDNTRSFLKLNSFKSGWQRLTEAENFLTKERPSNKTIARLIETVIHFFDLVRIRPSE